MNEKERKVYDFLCNWKHIQAMSDFVEERDDLSTPQKEKRQELLEKAAQRLGTWMCMLDDDERFVVKRHLVDGISWVRVVYEYNHLLKRPVQKSCSSLRRIQQRAIAKMEINGERPRNPLLF